MKDGGYLEIGLEFKSWNQELGLRGFYKGPTQIGNNTSAAAVLKCSSQNQAVCTKLNVFLLLLSSSGKPKAVLLLLALWANIEQQGREIDYVFGINWPK